MVQPEHTDTLGREVVMNSTSFADEQSQSIFDEDYPLGRMKAWLTVAGSFLLTFCSAGVPTSFGVFQDFYTQSWLSNCTASQISWIGSVQLFLEMCLAAVAGSLVDSGYFRVTIVAGCALLTFSLFMLSLSSQHEYYQVFLSQGVGMGLGIGLLYLPASTVVSHHFKTRKSLALGIVSSSGSLGGVVFSIMLNKLIHGPIGFTWGVRTAAFMILGCCIFANLLVFEPKRRVLHPARTAGGAEPSITLTIWDTPFILILIGAFLLSLGTYFPIFYIQLFAKLHGVNEGLAFYSVAMFNASCMLGRIMPNFLADRFGPMNVFMICLGACGPIIVAMLGCGHPVGLILFVIFYGFFVGGLLSVYFPMIIALRQSNVDIGKRMGFSLIPVGLAYLVGSPIMGVALGANYAWWKGVAFASITMTTALILFTIVKFVILKAHPNYKG